MDGASPSGWIDSGCRYAFIFDSLTYRASTDWGELLGYSARALAEMNLMALELYREVARESGLADHDVIVSGYVGPKGRRL